MKTVSRYEAGGDRRATCFAVFVFLIAMLNCACADDSTSKVREGMKLYSSEQFEEASKSFAEASELLEKAKSDMAAVAAFDEACALHRKGDLELAKDRYLKAGLSQNKGIATNAHYNLGVIASEQARKLAGESPETIPPDKRKEILAELSKSIDSYRHCLELQPQHASARRNLELLRQWNKYYIDRWREADLKKRRDETNLIQFLEYLIQTQHALMETVGTFRSNTSPNTFAELKRLQEELREEIPYLKDKIDSDLRPKEQDSTGAAAQSNSPKRNEELERGIALLSGWADDAGSKMVAAEKELMKREASAATDKQQKAADQLDQIWDAVVPFHPLLAKELVDQTLITKQLTPPGSSATPASDDASNETNEDSAIQPQKLEVKDNEWAQILEKQERALRKARLLAPKAESELARVESQPKPDDTVTDNPQVGNPQVGDHPAAPAGPKIDPEAIKAGYQKALELAPKAVEEMKSAVKQLGKRDRAQAASHAEEAKRILQEIQDAQPKNPEQQQQDQNKDQDKNEQQDKDQGKDQNEKKEKEDKDSKDEKEKQDEQKKDKQDEKKQGEDDKKDKDKKDEQRQAPKVSQDRIEEALRRVREREQEKRERDRELKARVLGRVPVDKDW